MKPPEAGSGIDWDAIRGRLERSMAACDPSAAGRDASEELLRTRATALARPALQAQASGLPDLVEVLAFEVGGERYAVDTAFAVQALPLPPLTALPGLPNHVAGIVPFRGRVLAVLDPRSLLSLPLARLCEPGSLLVLQDEAMEFALLADAIGAVCRYPRAALKAGAALNGGNAGRYLLGVAPDRTAVLDAAALLRDSTLVVQAGR
jgi:purine-binding chemotaxis protein CheW